MALVLDTNWCPCCGYSPLIVPAYRFLGPPPWKHPGPPPYCQWHGKPSYDVCACCGFEFGNDDEPGTALPVTFAQYLAEWIAGGCEWFDPAPRPEDWDLAQQLRAAGIKMPG